MSNRKRKKELNLERDLILIENAIKSYHSKGYNKPEELSEMMDRRYIIFNTLNHL